MNQDFLAVLEYMEKEKGINRKVMLDAVQTALLAACRKAIGSPKDLRIEIDPKSGKIGAYAQLKVVDKVASPNEEIQLLKARQAKITAQLGEFVEVEVTPRDFGRIAAQVFKQTINQNIRSIERGMIMDEFKDRAGEIVTGTVRRFDRSDVIVDLGKFEAVIPAKERVATEEYTPGERIRALVLEVESSQRGPQIVLSRSHPNFVRRLLELEVSELHDKTVEIKGLAREAGYRTKIAVWSNDEKIDPVGACVGIRGARVKNIVRELNNEKIDLFRWSPNINEVIIEALKPAKLKKIEVDQSHKKIKVIVDEENLSLAIGRRGQNARLASKVIGWEIDIEKEKSEVMGFEQKLEHAIKQLTEVLKIDRETAQKIAAAGFASVEGILSAEESDLLEALPDMDPELIKKIHAAALATQESAQKS